MRNIDSKIFDFNDLKEFLSKKKNEKVVFTNGCFDILHRGHVSYLQNARGLGDFLIVGVNSDRSVSRLKGPTRPIQNEDDRLFILAGLECVDAVVLFEEDTPIHLIEHLLPNILVKGGDYVIEEIVGYEVVMKNGGLVTTLPFVEGKSTSNIVKKMK
jgi:D-beta-D-heptose 7-phosphate kinase/D-beta-D-heptose 1-phosphate adenosyltransferase